MDGLRPGFGLGGKTQTLEVEICGREPALFEAMAMGGGEHAEGDWDTGCCCCVILAVVFLTVMPCCEEIMVVAAELLVRRRVVGAARMVGGDAAVVSSGDFGEMAENFGCEEEAAEDLRLSGATAELLVEVKVAGEAGLVVAVAAASGLGFRCGRGVTSGSARLDVVPASCCWCCISWACMGIGATGAGCLTPETWGGILREGRRRCEGGLGVRWFI